MCLDQQYTPKRQVAQHKRHVTSFISSVYYATRLTSEDCGEGINYASVNHTINCVRVCVYVSMLSVYRGVTPHWGGGGYST